MSEYDPVKVRCAFKLATSCCQFKWKLLTVNNVEDDGDYDDEFEDDDDD